MSSWSPLHAPRGTRLLFRHHAYTYLLPRRYISTSSPKACTIKTQSPDPVPVAPTAPARQKNADLAPLSRLPNKLLLRSLLLSSLMTSKIFLRPSLALLNALASSKSAFLNPDKNPLLNRLVRWTLYNHFCPGTNRAEVVRTVNEIKNMGYQGVILGYSKEVVLDHSESKPNKQGIHETSSTAKDYPPQYYEVIEEWKRGTLETLRMIGPGDFLALKYALQYT